MSSYGEADDIFLLFDIGDDDVKELQQIATLMNRDMRHWLVAQVRHEVSELRWYERLELSDEIAEQVWKWSLDSLDALLQADSFGQLYQNIALHATVASAREVRNTELFQALNKLEAVLTGLVLNLFAESDEQAVVLTTLGKFLRSLAYVVMETYRFEDMARMEEKQQQLEEARALAVAANNAKSVFLANMSHEIRTPLNAIIGLTTLALDSHPPQQIADYLRKSRFFSRSLLGIMNDLLDFSRIEAGKMTIEISDFDLREIVVSLADLVNDEVKRKGISFHADIAAGVPSHLRGDPLRINQILSNLVYNAVKFTHDGSVSVNVVCESETPRPRLRFLVQDSGIGIAPDQLSNVFESFTQLENTSARKYRGAGLGLSICKRLVELMGGTLSAESAPGQGSTFAFTLELDRQDPSSPDRQKTRSSDIGRLRGRRILVVDDVDINAEILRDILTRAGADVRVAYDGYEALKALEAESFAAVLMDVEMPGMDGYTATREIRSRKTLVDLPVIAVTALAMADDVQRCLDAGMNAQITKPIDAEALLATLASHVSPIEADVARPAIDREVLLSRMGDQPANVKKVYEIFNSTRGQSLEPIEAAVQLRRLDGLSGAAEILRGSLQWLSATCALDELNHVEHCATANDWDGATQAYQRLRAELIRLDDAVMQLTSQV